jgi:hypothetical protein
MYTIFQKHSRTQYYRNSTMQRCVECLDTYSDIIHSIQVSRNFYTVTVAPFATTFTLLFCMSNHNYFHLPMTEEDHQPAGEPAPDLPPSRLHRTKIFGKFKHRSSPQKDFGNRSSSSHLPSPLESPRPPSRLHSTYGIRGNLPDVAITERFSDLHDGIQSHVNQFYTTNPVVWSVSQVVVEHASTGIMLPWPQIFGLLGQPRTRLATLTLCIAWTVLSRSLMLRLGISSSPGSTFLPPELIECFQSFSLSKGPVTLGKDESNPVNFALLSRWKRISATLLHSTYVVNAFSHFDSRTINIERALTDLDPLLRIYRLPHETGYRDDDRIDHLRDVLRQGAKFAFTLFSQSCFWKFDWASDRALANGKNECRIEGRPVSNFDSEGEDVTELSRLIATEIVCWPTLVRIMDGEGVELDGEGERIVFGKKKYLDEMY